MVNSLILGPCLPNELSIITVCSPLNKTLKSLVHLNLSVTVYVCGLPLNWSAYGCLDTIDASFERSMKHVALEKRKKSTKAQTSV